VCNGPRTTDNEQSIVLRTESLTKIFRSGNEDVVVFEDLNLEIKPGEFVALVGESGSGKTTLLHLLAALDTPTKGEVYFAGKRLSEFRGGERALYRNKKVGFVWQMQYLLPEFSAIENVEIPQLIGGRPIRDARARARELLGEVGLENASERRVGELSGGEHRTAQRVIDLLEKLHGSHGLTSVLATHNQDLARRANRTLRLANGRLT
jgi:lipoprotein-releasing system ATP-binding protein